MKKGSFNFVWIFALFVGGMILVLAVYGSMKAGNTLKYEADTKTAKSIATLTDPMQAGFSEGSFSTITFREATEINNFCSDSEGGGFGMNSISVKSDSNMGNGREISGVKVSLNNKYIFSEEKMKGEKYYVFSKPFKLPFKVADMLFMSEKKYCFIDAPDEILEEVLGMNLGNIQAENCTEDFVNVCFGSGADCDVRVLGNCGNGCEHKFETGYVEKDGEKIAYVGGLLYGAIFSDKDVYECNVKRLLYRTSKVSEILVEKADLMDARNCETNLKGDVILWESRTQEETSSGLFELYKMGKTLDRRDKMAMCGLWNN